MEGASRPSPHQHLRAQMETPTQDQYHYLRICLPRDVQGSMIRIVHRVDKPLILRLSTRQAFTNFISMTDIERRNRHIKLRFNQLLGKHPVMVIYAQLGYEFYLSERRIREIIAS